MERGWTHQPAVLCAIVPKSDAAGKEKNRCYLHREREMKGTSQPSQDFCCHRLNTFGSAPSFSCLGFCLLQRLWKIDPGSKYCDVSDFHSKHLQRYFALFVLVLLAFSPSWPRICEQSGLRVRLRDVVKMLVSFIALDTSMSNIGHTSPTNPHTLAPPYPSGCQYFCLWFCTWNPEPSRGQTQYIWPINCGVFCFATWREQRALDQLRSEMLVLQSDRTNRCFARQRWIYWHELVCTVSWWSHTFHPMTFLTFSWFPSCRNTSAVKCHTLLNKLGISSSWLIWYVFTLVDFSTLLAIELPSCLHKYDFIISFV